MLCKISKSLLFILQGHVVPTFYLSLRTQLTMAEITDCAGNISDYLLPHSTWGEPILPTLPGCAAVEFTSDEFTPHSDGWLCLQGAAGAYRARQVRALPSDFSDIHARVCVQLTP